MKKSIQRSLSILGALVVLVSMLIACVSVPNVVPTNIPSSPTPLPLPSALPPIISEPTATTTGKMEIPAMTTDVTGVSLYRLSCAACHGEDRAGKTFEDGNQSISIPALAWDDLNSMYATQPSRGSVTDQLALAITKGQDEEGEEMDPMMPRWSSLSQAQVTSLIEYLRTSGSASVVESALSPAAMNLMGGQLYVTACAACHGIDGAGKTFERQGNTILIPALHWGELNGMYSENPSRGSVTDQLSLAITKGLDETGADMGSVMPRWSFLSQSQVDSLLAYLQMAYK